MFFGDGFLFLDVFVLRVVEKFFVVLLDGVIVIVDGFGFGVME